jgi:hypothetical protein
MMISMRVFLLAIYITVAGFNAIYAPPNEDGHLTPRAPKEEAQLVTQQQQMVDGSLGTYYTY